MKDLFELQREFFKTNKTKDIEFRMLQLEKLKAVIQDSEKDLYQAIYDDFKKSEFDTFMTEIGLIYHEINCSIKSLKKWIKPKSVWTGLVNFPGHSYIYPEPYGVTLIIGAWNYPYMLTLMPLISAITAGNTVILKPSELSARSSEALSSLINDNFEKSFMHSVQGDASVCSELLSHKSDKIFFTGSTNVGRIVAQAAAKHLTPVTLELGGKSPCFIMSDADLKMSAKRIIWGKFLNAGQTCIAPDYLLVEKSIYQEFLVELKQQVRALIGSDPRTSENYPRIITQRHWSRLVSLIDHEKVVIGGEHNESERYISPTIMENVSFDDPVMEEEIFGPILPIITFDNLDEVISVVKSRPKPLALYFFSKSKSLEEKIVREISFGGGTFNDTIMHISNPNLPFGGVGDSGMGSYHGKRGFDTFSHHKSILKRGFWFEAPVKYTPYSSWKRWVLKLLLGLWPK